MVRDEYKEQAIRDIQRPLADTSIMIAHAASRLQVTEISALKNHQRSRLTAFAAFAALLAIRFSAERGRTAPVATILHHRMIQRHFAPRNRIHGPRPTNLRTLYQMRKPP